MAWLVSSCTRSTYLIFLICLSASSRTLLADPNQEADSNEREPIKVQLPEYVIKGYDLSSYSSELSQTATRFPVEHAELPLIINVLSNYLLEEQQAITLAEAASNLSNVEVKSTPSGQGNQLSVRGFNSFTLIDGFRLGNSNSSSLGAGSYPYDLANIERIEVLKGPASTLHGRGLPGGVVNFITKKPQFTPHTELQATFGSESLQRGIIDTTRPVNQNESLAYRLIATYTSSESHRNSIESLAKRIYPSLTWKPTADTQLHIRTEYSKAEYTPDQGSLFLPNGESAPASSRSFFWGDSDDQIETKQFGAQSQLQIDLSEVYRIQAQAGARRAETVGTATVGTNLAGNSLERVQRELDESREDYLFQIDQYLNLEHSLFKQLEISHELLLSTNAQQIRTESNRSESSASSLDIDTGQTQAATALATPTIHFEFRSSEAGVGLQDRIQIGDRIHILLATRFDYARLSYDLSPYPLHGSLDEENLSYRAGFIYKVSPSLSIFTNYGTAFRPALRNTSTGQTLYDIQKSIQYESGFKIVTPSKRLTFNAALYHLINQDVVITDSLGNPQTSDQTASGAELDLSVRLAHHTTLLFNYAYTQSEYSSGPFANNSLFGTPEHKAGLWLRQDILSEADHNLSINLGVQYHSHNYASDANHVKLPAAAQISAGLQYTAKAWTLQFQAYNLFNEMDYITSEHENTGGTNSPIFALPVAPRHFRISASYAF